jgi:hypothetical protein
MTSLPAGHGLTMYSDIALAMLCTSWGGKALEYAPPQTTTNKRLMST